VVVYSQVSWPDAPAGLGGDTVRMIGRALFTDFIIPFELAAVLLLIALIGAIVIAVRDNGRREQG